MIATIVQHHPARAELLPALLERLPSGALVVTDPDPDSHLPNPWRCYRACLEAIPVDASHAVIVQDDVIPHPDFPVVMPRCVDARPGRLICFFVASQPVLGARRIIEAQRSRNPWAELSHTDFLPVVATCWPVPLARLFLDWAVAHALPRDRSDDGLAGRWIRHRALRPLATVPSLVEHPDVERSLIGKRAMAGKNPARVALVRPYDDITSIDWT